MNQADILKLAETAGFAVEIESRFSAKIWALNQCRFDGTCNADVTDELTRFAELVAQHERDACLKLAQDLADMYAEREYYRCSELRTDAETGLRELEEAIRARNKS